MCRLRGSRTFRADEALALVKKMNTRICPECEALLFAKVARTYVDKLRYWPFIDWLQTQQNRPDDIGEFARDVADLDLGDSGASVGFEVLNAAWAEFIAARPSALPH